MNNLHPKGLDQKALETAFRCVVDINRKSNGFAAVTDEHFIELLSSNGGAYYEDLRDLKYYTSAYLSAAEPASPWLPIESAPKDGNCLLKIKTDEGFEYAVLERRDDGAWIHDGEPTYCHSYYFEPVEWTPIPEAPRQGA